MFALPLRPATAPMLTIFPRPAASIFGTTARAVLITDFALRSTMSSQTLSGVSCTGCPMRKPPAILHRTSIPGNRTAATACATEAASSRSARSTSLRSSSRPKADRRTLSSRSIRTREAPADAKAAASARPRLPAAPVIRQVSPSNVTAQAAGGPAGLGDLLRVCLAGLRPVFGRSLRLGKRLGVLEPRRHRRRSPGKHLVVVDVEQPQPALLPHGEGDGAAELDELGLAEMPLQTFPERIVGIEMPGDRLGIRERCFLAVVAARGFFEIEQVLDVLFHDPRARSLDRALVAAIVTLHRARHVQSAELLDGVVAHTLVEQVAPGVRKGPESRRHVGAHRRALRPRRALALAALHFLLHLRIHLFQREIADALLAAHAMSPRLRYSPSASGANKPAASGIPSARSSRTGSRSNRCRCSCSPSGHPSSRPCGCRCCRRRCRSHRRRSDRAAYRRAPRAAP